MRRPRLPRAPAARVAILVAFLAVGVAVAWWRGPDWGVVGDAFTAVAWAWVLAALALNFLSVLARSTAWEAVIDQAMPPPRPARRTVFAAFCVGLLANAVLPGRIGELARVAVITRREPRHRKRDAWATLVGTVFAHRVFDLVAMSLLILYVLTVARIPAWALTSLAAIVVVAVAAVTFGVASARRHHRPLREELGALGRVVTMARHGLGVMRQPLAAAGALVLQAAAWSFQLFAVYAAMRAFNIEEPLVAAGLVLVLMNVAMIFPLWPGNIGLLQAAVALPLVSYGIDYAHGFAFAIGLQAIEASVGVALGLAFLAREGLSFAMLRHMPDAAQAEVPDGEPEPAVVAPERPRVSV